MIPIMSEHFTRTIRAVSQSKNKPSSFSLRQQGIHPNLFLQICLKLGTVLAREKEEWKRAMGSYGSRILPQIFSLIHTQIHIYTYLHM